MNSITSLISRIKYPWSQWILVLEIWSVAIVIGSVNGWLTPALSKLMDSSSSISVDKNQASWLASVLDIGRVVGSIIGVISIEYLGTKTSYFCVGLIEVVGLILLLIANSVYWILISRFICGLALGVFYMSSPNYIGEVSDPRYRGAFTGLAVTGATIGNILGNVLGNYMDHKGFVFIVLALTSIFVGSFGLLPKSPHFLILTKQTLQATASIKFYRGDIDIPAELKSLNDFLKSKQASTSMNTLKELMMIPYNRRGLIKINILFLLAQFSGHSAVTYYTQVILEEVEKANVLKINPASVVIAVTSAGLIGSVLGMFTSDRFGRKVLLGISCTFVAVSQITLGLFYELMDRGFDPLVLQFLLIGSLLIRMIFLSYGVYSVPLTLLSEMFSPNVKYISVCIVNIVSSLSVSISVKMHQPLLDSIGHNIYYFYATMMILAALYTIMFLSETKGKTLQDIQVMLKK